MPSKSGYTTRVARREEVPFFFEQSKARGWNPCPGDLELFYELDPEGFLVGEYEGKVIACVTGFKFDETYAFVGYYVALPEYRGKGFGLTLFSSLQERLRTCRVVALDAVLEKTSMYETSGFKELYRNIRYTGYGTKGPIPALPASSDGSWCMCRVSEFSRKEDVVQYDTKSKAHCVPREALMTKLLSQQDGFVVTSQITESKDCVIGYGLMRRALDGWRCGPIVADSSAVGAALLAALRAAADPSEKFCLDVPSVSSQSLALVQSLDFSPGYTCPRMYTATPEDIDASKVYAQYSSEIG